MGIATKDSHRPELVRELAAEIQTKRGFERGQSERLASTLLSYDASPTLLVGLPPSAEKAMYFYEERSSILCLEFDEDGPDERGGREIAYLEKLSVEWWLRRRPNDWDWVHPRYSL